MHVVVACFFFFKELSSVWGRRRGDFKGGWVHFRGGGEGVCVAFVIGGASVGERRPIIVRSASFRPIGGHPFFCSFLFFFSPCAVVARFGVSWL